jgi:hypothetical protein
MQEYVTYGEYDLQFQIPNNYSSGVYTLTLIHYSVPLAERLVVIKQSGKLRFDIKSLGNRGSLVYATGETAKLEITTVDSSGNPIPAIFSVKVMISFCFSFTFLN